MPNGEEQFEKFPKSYKNVDVSDPIEAVERPKLHMDSKGRLVMRLSDSHNLLLRTDPGSKTTKQGSEDQGGNPDTDPGSIESGALDPSVEIEVGAGSEVFWSARTQRLIVGTIDVGKTFWFIDKNVLRGGVGTGKNEFTAPTDFNFWLQDEGSFGAGDFFIGSLATGYLWWDRSVPKLTISGSLEASSIHIPDISTTVQSFHVDVTGNVWIGAVGPTFTTTAPFWIRNDGDFQAGNTATSNYINWNGTTLTVRGDVQVDSLHVPDTTTADSFHVDTSGNMWIGFAGSSFGASQEANAKAWIKKTGEARFTNVEVRDSSKVRSDILTSVSGGVITGLGGFYLGRDIVTTTPVLFAGDPVALRGIFWTGSNFIVFVRDTTGFPVTPTEAGGFDVNVESSLVLSDTPSPGENRVRVNGNGVIVRNTRGVFFEQTTAGLYAALSVNTSNQLVIDLPTTNQLFVVNSAGTTNLFTISAADGAFADKNGFLIGGHFRFVGVNPPFRPGQRFVSVWKTVTALSSGSFTSPDTFSFTTNAGSGYKVTPGGASQNFINFPNTVTDVFPSVETTGSARIFVRWWNPLSTGFQWSATNASTSAQTFNVHFLIFGY